jgi:imidazole glycerol-phosphate synthase subunit HisH
VTRRNIGIVDYGIGNFSSVQNTLRRIGHRCRISSDPEILAANDVIILPGVGAFPAAMENLKRTGLGAFVQGQARSGQPIIGLCLGMQLMMDESVEHRRTAGLGLIPGQVVAFDQAPWHIGWNNIESVGGDPILGSSDGMAVYFNHSYMLDLAEEYHLCVSRLARPFVAGIRRGNIVGLQFHPEKSQYAGRVILRNLIEGLCNA